MAGQVPVASESNASENTMLYVLVVDDDPILRRIHAQLMNMVGLKVETQAAENGQIAVEKCRHSAKSFDIILMDMEMPIKNGIEASDL